MLNPSQLRSLITAENCLSGLLAENVVRSAADFHAFSDVSRGIPILTPADETVFRFQIRMFHSIWQKYMRLYMGAVRPIILDLRHRSALHYFVPI